MSQNVTEMSQNATEFSTNSFVVGITFLVVMFFTLRPVIVELCNRRIKLDFSTAPFAGVLILLAAKCIIWNDVVFGIVGNSSTNNQRQFEPYAALILFFSQCYMSISLDHSGLFAFLSVKLAQRSHTSYQLLTLMYVSSSFATLVGSSDAVVLTITPLICYFTEHLNIDPMPFLIASYMACNLWNSLLYVGDTTNILISEVIPMSAAEYSVWLTIPVIVSGLVCYGILCLVFHSSLLRTLNYPEDISPITFLKNHFSAKFGSIVFIASLITITATSSYNIPSQIVIVPFVIVSILRDMVEDIYIYWSAKVKQRKLQEVRAMLQKQQQSLELQRVQNELKQNELKQPENGLQKRVLNQERLTNQERETNQDRLTEQERIIEQERILEQERMFDIELGNRNEFHQQFHNQIQLNSTEFLPVEFQHLPLSTETNELSEHKENNNFPNNNVQNNTAAHKFVSWSVLRQLPWETLPFMLSMFVFVEALQRLGWIGKIATALSTAVGSSVLSSILVIGCISAILGCFISNLPMAIFMTRIISHPNFVVSSQVRRFGLLSMILSANNTSNLALSSALSGLLWCRLLKEKDIEMTFVKFLKYGLLVTPWVILSSLLTLYIETLV